MGRLIRRMAALKSAAFMILVMSLTACPPLGDPHIETGFRVGPMSEKTQEALLRAVCGTEVLAKPLPKGSYLWGGPLPAGSEECRELDLCRATWSNSVLTRSVVCRSDRYAYVFYSGLQATLKPERAGVCKKLSYHSSRMLFSAPAEKGTLLWWTEGANGTSLEGLGCTGK